MSRIIFRTADVMKYFGISKYRLNQWLADGILAAPVREAGRHPFWLARQIQAAERKLDELAKPATAAPGEYKPTRGLNASQTASVRAFEAARKSEVGR